MTARGVKTRHMIDDTIDPERRKQRQPDRGRPGIDLRSRTQAHTTNEDVDPEQRCEPDCGWTGISHIKKNYTSHMTNEATDPGYGSTGSTGQPSPKPDH